MGLQFIRFMTGFGTAALSVAELVFARSAFQSAHPLWLQFLSV